LSPNQPLTKVRLGSPFQLECFARGNPLPSIRIETPGVTQIRFDNRAQVRNKNLFNKIFFIISKALRNF